MSVSIFKLNTWKSWEADRLAIRQMIYGMVFIAGLLAAVMTIPMVSRVSPDVITRGVSPLVSIAGSH
jgi:hypothetical protein